MKSIRQLRFFQSMFCINHTVPLQIEQMTSPMHSPPQESQSACIPIHSIDYEAQPTYTIGPMNAMEHHLVDQIKKSRKRAQKQCRICLENGEQISKMVTPCKCNGSIQYAHEHCMIEWIKRKVQSEPKRKAQCQVCHTDFRYRLANQRHFDCVQLSKHYKKDKKSIFCFFIVYGLFLFFWFAYVILVAISKNNSSLFLNSFLKQSAGMTVTISILVLYIIAMLIITILFISEYLVKEDVVVTRVLNFYQPLTAVKNMRVYFQR